MKERLQKIIAECGIVSRRKAEDMLSEGRVRVNGRIAHLGDTAERETDRIELDGAALAAPPEKVWLMLNKPRGYLTTMHDERGRSTAVELVSDCPVRVYPVGRLDLYSEGLLLFTNDGDTANRLIHPRREVEKVYLVWVNGFYAGAEQALQEPIVLDGRPIRKPQVSVQKVQEKSALLEITIHEGRNRQIRRMCEAASLKVTRLRRIREGALRLDRLAPGAWRYLREEELAWLKTL